MDEWVVSLLASAEVTAADLARARGLVERAIADVVTAVRDVPDVEVVVD